MNYHEKRTITTSLVGLAIAVIYVFNAIMSYGEGTSKSQSLDFWASKILIFIGIGVVTMIIANILFHILYSVFLAIGLKREHEDMTDQEIQKMVTSLIDTDMKDDEMAKLIELKSMSVGFAFAGVGFVLSLVSLLLGYSPIIMINVLYISFNIGFVLSGFLELYYYKRGVHRA